jgi:hypothetical protein
MKKIFLTLAVLFISLLSNPIFAQEGLTDPGTEDPELGGAPIDNYVWYLAVIGLIYVFYKVRSRSLQSK